MGQGGGSGGSWVSQWENAFGLGARYQGGQGGHVQIEGKPDGEKFHPNYPTPNPRTPKQTLRNLAIAAAQPHCAEQLRKWRKKEKEGKKRWKGEGGEKSKTK
jgi:hypothetical protein